MIIDTIFAFSILLLILWFYINLTEDKIKKALNIKISDMNTNIESNINDYIDTLQTELEEAVLVAFSRGAVDWCILNHYRIIKPYIREERIESNHLYINNFKVDDDVKEFYNKVKHNA